MAEIRIPKEKSSQPISWLNLSEEENALLERMGCKTVWDVIEHQKKLPPKTLTRVKAKLIFNIDNFVG